ncbi:Zn-ribbon domain-containing OB-fold protein [Frankia sp. R43]|uniref:Zn-ribbon domain-containing OB-fold protein n=1 Tax=Frankia sp. R43 TaxID=269536 RepID=UPI001F48ABEA|nr:Zn-ribbon domain-containing OB-fold protein [Frankia sp. R43]
MSRPAPAVTEDNEFFWGAARENRLVAQRCAACGLLRHPPAVSCPACHSHDHEIVQLSGRGQIYSYALLHHPRHPRFHYPVVAVLIDLEDGIRILSNLVDADPASIHIGQPVEVTFEPTDDTLGAPVFRPRPRPRTGTGTGTGTEAHNTAPEDGDTR